MSSDIPHLEGFTFEKYAQKELEKQTGESLEGEINQAAQSQEERASTPDVDWELRYKELEKLNSRQAQELGGLRQETQQYRAAFDEYLLNEASTPADAQQAPQAVTTDDLLDRPDEVISQAIENHPAIRQAREAAEIARKQAILAAKSQFEDKHPSYQETMSNPAFAEWVRGSSARMSLAQQADQWNFDAADALFSLYEAEQALQGVQQQQATNEALQQAELEHAGVGEPPPDAKFSRREMRELMIRAAQGDEKAERLKADLMPAYRAALQAGEVTD
jgi:hypothetical protein